MEIKPLLWRAVLLSMALLTALPILAVFGYVFRDMGCERLFAAAEASNVKSLRFLSRLGYTTVAELDGAARDGGPMVIHQLLKMDCSDVDS